MNERPSFGAKTQGEGVGLKTQRNDSRDALIGIREKSERNKRIITAFAEKRPYAVIIGEVHHGSSHSEPTQLTERVWLNEFGTKVLIAGEEATFQEVTSILGKELRFRSYEVMYHKDEQSNLRPIDNPALWVTGYEPIYQGPNQKEPDEYEDGDVVLWKTREPIMSVPEELRAELGFA